MIAIAVVLSNYQAFGQMAIFSAQGISLNNESRRDVYDQIMEAEWRIHGKTLHYGSSPIEVTTDEKMDTIFYRQKIKANWDTIICQISKPGNFTFVYNECCGGFNVKDESDHFVEAKVNFKIKGQDKRRNYIGTLGEAGLLIERDYLVTLMPGCRSAMSPNIYQLTLSEVDFPVDTSLENSSTCLFRIGYQDLYYDFAYRTIGYKFDFLYMPLSNDPILIIYDLKSGSIDVNTNLSQIQPQKPEGRRAKKMRTIKMFGWICDPGSACGNEVRMKYGFKKKCVGCGVTKRGVRHNIRTMDALTRRNGPDWWSRYVQDIKRCGNDCTLCEEEQ